MSKSLYVVTNNLNSLGFEFPEFLNKLIEESSLPYSLAIGSVIMGLNASHYEGVKGFKDFLNREDCVYMRVDNEFFYKTQDNVLRSITLEEVKLNEGVDIDVLGSMLEAGNGLNVPIALSYDTKGYAVPKFLEEKVNSVSYNSRVAVAKCIMQLDVNGEDMEIDEGLDKLRRGEINYLKRYKLFYFRSKGTIRCLFIGHVNINKRWRIDRSDFFENIVYMNEYNCIDKLLNMYE